jgi:hypothetical protein
MYKKAIAAARRDKARSVRTGLTPQQEQEFKEVSMAASLCMEPWTPACMANCQYVTGV